jgi:hypothetical protein
MKTIIFIFLIFISRQNVFAETFSTNNFTLRAGLSFNLTEIRTDRLIDNHEASKGDTEDETRTSAYGFVTSIGYRFKDWELACASDAIFGTFKDVTFIDGSNSIRGGGSIRLVSIGPQVKYYTPYTAFNVANFYLGFGPSWSLETFVFSHSRTSGTFNDKKRISFENYGGGIFIGVEEIHPFKEKHPMFLEVGYSYMHSYKVSVLDSTNSTDVITLSEGDSNDFSAQYIIVRAGLTLF